MVMMTLDELCAAIRAGKVGTIVTYLNDEDARMGKMALSFWGLQQDADRAALCTPAFEEALAPHRGAVASLVYLNDARVCMSPDEHKAWYVPYDGGRLGPGQYCEECASLRDEHFETMDRSVSAVTMNDLRNIQRQGRRRHLRLVRDDE